MFERIRVTVVFQNAKNDNLENKLAYKYQFQDYSLPLYYSNNFNIQPDLRTL